MTHLHHHNRPEGAPVLKVTDMKKPTAPSRPSVACLLKCALARSSA